MCTISVPDAGSANPPARLLLRNPTATAHTESRDTMLELMTQPEAWMAFLTLTVLELVLGIDNVIFISILVDKLPAQRREAARRIGLFLAMFMRIALLLVLSWIVGLREPLFSVFELEISGRDLILIVGGLFLIWKSTREIHQLLEGAEGEASSAVRATFSAVLVQIILIDIVFSLDSIITAVGMVDEVEIMIAAVVVSVALMMLFAGSIGRFVSAHPTIKMLALSFLLTIGLLLVADGTGHHVPKGYIYFAMAFSVLVEMLNLRLRKKETPPVDLHEPYSRER
jgi:predicted tellurium resistance membrane protein TerC